MKELWCKIRDFVSKGWAKVRSIIKPACPYLRVFIPDVRTVCLLYILVMAFIFRGNIDGYLALHFSEQLEFFFDLLTSNPTVNWATTLLLLVGGSLLVFQDYKRKAYSWPIIICGFALIYLLLDNNWEWAQCPIKHIDYKDLLFVFSFVLFGFGVLRIVRVLKSIPTALTVPINMKNGLTNSTPKQSRQDTGWDPYAKNMVSKLLNTDIEKESFAVGISGVWGGGKTTFLEAIKDEFEGKAYLLEFRPWYCETPEQITRDFFETFIDGLVISSYERRSIHKYANLLGSIASVKPFIDPIVLFLDDGDRSLGEAKKKAEDVIGSYESPVVMIIDDLDRLDERELLCVLKLIRTSANFKNLIFILAYDKNHLSQCLMNVGGEEFLKKIVQLEVCLPDYESFILKEFLFGELNDKGIQESDLNSIKKRLRYLDYSILDYLPTFRDINRFVNLFCLNYNSFELAGTLSEICPGDLFFVELLHYFDEKAYQFLRTCPIDTLFSISMGSGHRVEYKYIKPQLDKNKITDEDERLAQTLSKYSKGFGDVLELLFGVCIDDEKGMIKYPINYSKYFSLRVNKDVISLDEFNCFIENADIDEIKARIKEYCRGDINKHSSFYSHLVSTGVDKNNKIKVFNFIYSILALCRYYRYNIRRIGSLFFSDVDFSQEPDIWEALKRAVLEHVRESKSMVGIIQDFLASVVCFSHIDPTDEDSSVYVQKNEIPLLCDLSGQVFFDIIGNRNIPIVEITDEHSRIHGYLKKAVALVGQVYMDTNEVLDLKQSLLADALTRYYSKMDNSSFLDEFFNNLDPNKDGFEWGDDEVYSDLIRGNIGAIFGNVYSFRDFYSFLRLAFPNQLPKVNECLIRVGLEPITDANEQSGDND